MRTLMLHYNYLAFSVRKSSLFFRTKSFVLRKTALGTRCLDSEDEVRCTRYVLLPAVLPWNMPRRGALQRKLAALRTYMTTPSVV